MFAYCGNNPVTRADNGGQFWHLVVGTVVGAAVGAVSNVVGQVISQVAEGKSFSDIEIDATNVLIATATGAATGFLAATGAGVVAQVAGNAVASAAGNALTQVNDISRGAQDSWDWDSFVFDTCTGAVAGLWGGNGASYGKSKGIMKSGYQFTKRVFNNVDELTKAAAYYVKTAHQAGGSYVMTELGKSLGKSFVVSTGNGLIKATVELRIED